MACSRTPQGVPSPASADKSPFSLGDRKKNPLLFFIAFEGLTSLLLQFQDFRENKLSAGLVR